MLTEDQKTWIAALRSGKYAQGKSLLCNENHQYCCLGVAAEIFAGNEDKKVFSDVFGGWKFNGAINLAPPYVIEKLGLFNDVGVRADKQESLAYLNDRGMTFDEIADLLEAHPEDYFRA